MQLKRKSSAICLCCSVSHLPDKQQSNPMYFVYCRKVSFFTNKTVRSCSRNDVKPALNTSFETFRSLQERSCCCFVHFFFLLSAPSPLCWSVHLDFWSVFILNDALSTSSFGHSDYNCFRIIGMSPLHPFYRDFILETNFNLPHF